MSGLPPGQRARADFPRFGLPQFAARFPKHTATIELGISGDVAAPLRVTAELSALPRVDQVSDFHCVTTWSHRGLVWSGVRFADFYKRIVQPLAQPEPGAEYVILLCQDGYGPSLPLADLLAPDVLLADRLNGAPLDIIHGAPLRLVAPAHYGYKNAKHLKAVEFWRNTRRYRSASFRFMDHPRARVAQEERGRFLPGWLLRLAYRPLIGPTVRRFETALARMGIVAHEETP